MGFKKYIQINAWFHTKTRIETAVKGNSEMVVEEGNLENGDIVLSSVSSFIVSSLNTKTKPGEDFKLTFMKAEIFVV